MQQINKTTKHLQYNMTVITMQLQGYKRACQPKIYILHGNQNYSKMHDIE